MSLINDALKRANQAQKKAAENRPPPTGPSPFLQPVETGKLPAPRWLVPVIAVALMVIAGIAFWKLFSRSAPGESLSGGRAVEAAGRPVQTVAVSRVTPVATEAAAPKPLLVPVTRTPAVASAPVQEVQPKTETRASVSPTPVATPETKPAMEIPATFPQLRLQAVFFRLSKPSAIINGKTVFVGEIVEGAKLIGIERQAVTLQLGPQKKVLVME